MKPVLDAVSGLGAVEINFLSGCAVLAMSLVSLLYGRGAGIILEPRRGTALAGGAALGGISGKLIFNAAIRSFAGTPMVRIIQSLVLIVLTTMVFIYIKNKKNIRQKNIYNVFFCIALGLFLGMVSAFLGIGGGPVNIMIISYFLSMDSKTAALHSLYTIFLSQTASLLITIMGQTMAQVNSVQLIAMITGGISGGLIGSRIAKALNHDQVDTIFSGILIAVMLLSVYNIIKVAAPMFFIFL